MANSYDVPVVFDLDGGLTTRSVATVLDKIVALGKTDLVLGRYTMPKKTDKKPKVTLEFEECACDEE